MVGLLGIIAGLVLLIEPDALHAALGVHRAHGATHLVGLLHLGAGLVMGRSGGVALPTARDGTPTA